MIQSLYSVVLHNTTLVMLQIGVIISASIKCEIKGKFYKEFYLLEKV